MGAGLRLVLYDRRWSRNELRKSLQVGHTEHSP